MSRCKVAAGAPITAVPSPSWEGWAAPLVGGLLARLRAFFYACRRMTVSRATSTPPTPPPPRTRVITLLFEQGQLPSRHLGQDVRPGREQPAPRPPSPPSCSRRFVDLSGTRRPRRRPSREPHLVPASVLRSTGDSVTSPPRWGTVGPARSPGIQDALSRLV